LPSRQRRFLPHDKTGKSGFGPAGKSGSDPDYPQHQHDYRLGQLPQRTATRAYAEQFGWQPTTDGQLAVFRSVLRKTA
jgi:hypothetical protein